MPTATFTFVEIGALAILDNATVSRSFGGFNSWGRITHVSVTLGGLFHVQ